MTDAATLLRALQYADSFFPAGGTALSWGVEPLVSDGEIDGLAQLKQFVSGQLRHRWATFDRWVLHKVHGAELGEIARIDALVQSMSLAKALREGSLRSGQALLGIHSRLGLKDTRQYREMIAAGEAFGHLAVMQGFIFDRLGLPLDAVEAISAHVMVTGFASSAVRLSHIGAADAQELIRHGRETAEELMRSECLGDLPSAFQPCVEIACMRHEARASRLFSN